MLRSLEQQKHPNLLRTCFPNDLGWIKEKKISVLRRNIYDFLFLLSHLSSIPLHYYQDDFHDSSATEIPYLACNIATT